MAGRWLSVVSLASTAFSSSGPEKPTTSSLLLVRSPRTRTFLGRDLPGNFTLEMLRSDAMQLVCVPGTTLSGRAFVQPAVIRASSPRCAAPPQGAVCRHDPAPPASGRCGLGLCSWGNHPGAFSVALTFRAVVLGVVSLTYDGSWDCAKSPSDYSEIPRM